MAYLTAFTEPTALSGSSWVMSAHSWPDDGLQGAGIPVAAQGSSTATLRR